MDLTLDRQQIPADICIQVRDGARQMGQIPEWCNHTGTLKVNQNERQILGREVNRQREQPCLYHFRLTGTGHTCHNTVDAVTLLMNIEAERISSGQRCNGYRKTLVCFRPVPSSRNIQFFRCIDTVTGKKTDTIGQRCCRALCFRVQRCQRSCKMVCFLHCKFIRNEENLLRAVQFAVDMTVIGIHFHNRLAVQRQRTDPIIHKQRGAAKLRFAEQSRSDRMFLDHTGFCGNKQQMRNHIDSIARISIIILSLGQDFFKLK